MAVYTTSPALSISYKFPTLEMHYLGFVHLPVADPWSTPALLAQMRYNRALQEVEPDYETLKKQALLSRTAVMGGLSLTQRANRDTQYHFLFTATQRALIQEHPLCREVLLVGWMITERYDVALTVQALPITHYPLIRLALLLQNARRLMNTQNRPTPVPTRAPVTKLRGSRLRTLVRAAINSRRLKNGDIVLLKSGTRLATEVSVNALAEALSRQGHSRSIVAIVDDFKDLAILNEAEMNKLGWYRIPEASLDAAVVYEPDTSLVAVEA